MDPLLTMLSTSEYLSGEWLCEKLGMTRGAVWKRMEKLREEGYKIVSAGKRGYRLEPVRDSLLAGYIAKELNTRWAGKGEIEYKAKMDSTNTRVKELAREGAPHGSIAICNHQVAGRGRLQRTWEVPEGEALTQSLLLRPKLATEQAQLCTLAVAVAVARAIEDLCPTLHPGIKWPNDVVLDGKKCVGISCELSADMDGIEFVVLGVGINVNQPRFSGELADKATSLLAELRRDKPSAKSLCRRALLIAYLEHIEDAMDALEREGLSGIMQDYKNRSVTLGACVRVIGANSEFVGVAQSIDDTGALLVLDERGQERRVLSGDVSVRGLMGYC